MNLNEWKKKRKSAKERKKDPYDKEELRLLLRMQKLTPGTDEYRECQAELRNINQSRAESRESKRRISKSDKGGIFLKVLGILGAGAGLGSIIWAERSGLTFTGEKRSVMDSISRAIGNVFVKH